MASPSLNSQRTKTGSISKTLGTLGRSIFNSTVGTFADSETMNQIYSTIDKLTNSIETTSKTIDNDALNGRNKADDLYTLLAGMDIKSSYDFMNKNREFMKRLMRLNKQERDITLNAIGVDVSGESNTVTNEYVRDYDHVKGNNYLEDYVKTLPQNQQDGNETTTLYLESNNHFNYSGVHNDLYGVRQNLYPDDNNQGTFANKWIVENRNSLLYKTKKLFNSKKIGTIISKFHTDPYRTNTTLDNAKSKYGLSHGRNLLTKTAERGANTSYVSGYDNPYCRVWTHHHQYDRYYKRIRPFATIDDQGNYVDTIKVGEFHEWNQFSDSKDTNSETTGKWGWKKSKNNGWQYSVLQDNGKVNITPKYIRGESSNIHTKQCMFSIENLAWRGYDPYSFEQALSWEQRGPLGGRIMWFPPYGIQFQETTSTQWANTTFLGRGEDVYTYSNTTRTGTLNFMMVVDHPSIIDYVTWTNANKNVTDTDILRFLAGCGEGDGNGLRDYAKPTPLTDEYTQIHEEVTADEEVKVEEAKTTPEQTKPSDKIISFYVFYPNNYSGTYDCPYSGTSDGYNTDSTSRVEAIPYLLAGRGAQKSGNSTTSTFADDVAINEDVNTWHKNGGYEMGNMSGLGTSNGYILGTSLYPNTLSKDGTKRRKWTGLGANGAKRSTTYSLGVKKISNAKKWYYRIDGRYMFPQSTAEEKYNYYNQTLETENGYRDTNSFGLNQKIESVYTNFKDDITTEQENGETIYKLKGNQNSSVYTLAEVAYAIYRSDEKKQEICGVDGTTERMKSLINILENNQIESIKGVGYASIHGYTDLNEELGKNRYFTAARWFAQNTNGCSIESPNVGQDSVGVDGDKERPTKSIKGDENTENAKKWRYARIDVLIKSTDTTTPATSTSDTTIGSNTTPTENTANVTDKSKAEENNTDKTQTTVTKTGNLIRNLGENKSVIYSPTGETGYCSKFNKNCAIYKDSNGKKWYKDTDSNKLVSVSYANEEEVTPKARYGNGKTDENRLRYDQEYHFFKVLKQEDPLVFNSLMDKLQYFDPAFHSMTPEGFNGRLTFLQQCMRQGNTVSASDGRFSKSANNLAFGRAPYCVLRLGDFYNQMIVIDNLSINYDPLVWDLNVEGIGVQPLIANVQLSFKFIGGGDLTGPVRRLQNAMSFNYYANARLYDNRADRIERYWSDKTCGAIEHDEILEDANDPMTKNKKRSEYYNKANNDASSFYNTQMYE